MNFALGRKVGTGFVMGKSSAWEPIRKRAAGNEGLMRLDRVVSLRKYRAERMRAERLREAGEMKTLPSAQNLWELLDRNISLDIWKKGI
jgi:hypothetical protein